MSTLIEVSKRLNSPRISALVRVLREPDAALRRVVLLLVYTTLVYVVARHGNATGLQREAIKGLPVIVACLGISVLWLAYLRLHKAVQERIWIDAAGLIANFVGVSVLLRLAWDVMLPLIATLPLSCITVGALHGRRTFFLSIAFSTIIVFSSTSMGYWESRPFVGMLALALLVGLPLTVTRLMVRLREISVEAIKAREAQSRFLATMSHELRTPLNSVVAATEIFQIEEDPEHQRQLMQTLAVNALVLRNRVNDVLDVRAIETGRLVFNTEPFTFGGLIKTVESVVAPQAREKDIHLRFITNNVDDMVLRSDPNRIEQMLTNLCTNALKFTPAGGTIVVNIKVWPDAANDRMVNTEITVSDTGIGIPDEVKARVFDPFYQVSAGVSRAAEGVGLGLFIVSSIAKIMGGAIDLHDNPGGGSVFTLVLQLERGATDERPSQVLDQKQAIADHRRTVRPMRVLIVDDNAANREIATRIIQKAGHTVATAASGVEAIEHFETEPFDLMLLDLFMPGTSGWVLLDRYQAQRRKGVRRPPIIVLSADANTDARDAALAKGATAYLLKPISTTKLLQLLKLVAAGVTRTTSPPNDADDEPLAWIDYLRAEGNHETLRHFITTSLTGIDKSVAELQQALRESNTPECLFHAHALKNDFINLAYPPGIEACKAFPQRLANGDGSRALEEIVDLATTVERKFAVEVA